MIDGLKRMESGEIDNGFCLVRPPGHHAEYDRAMGFCLFNSVAVAAQWALHHLGLHRILIVDWDLHHGNGTQNSFYRTKNVLYCSTHQSSLYPGTGTLTESGEGAGRGYTVNIPLLPGHGDREFARIFNEIIIPLAQSYQPELVLVSCGFVLFALEGGYDRENVRQGTLAVLRELYGVSLTSEHPVWLTTEEYEIFQSSQATSSSIDRAIAELNRRGFR